MRKKILGIMLAAVMLCACLALGGCSSDLKGTTWYYVASGEVKSIEFSGDETAVTSEGVSASYEIDGDTVTLSSTLGGMVLTWTNIDGADALVADSGETLYQDRSIPQKEVDDKRNANIEEANALKQQYIQELTDDLIGSYHFELENSHYDFTDSRDVVFNADGSWSFRSVSHEVDRVNGKANVAESEFSESGTWEVVYDDEKASAVGTTLTEEEVCDMDAFALKLTKADGSEFTQEERSAVNFGILIRNTSGEPGWDINPYTKTA